MLIRQTEAFDKPFAQPVTIVQRSAQKHHVTLDSAPLRESRNRLVNDRLINAGSQVFFARALVQQGLDVGFSEHAAAGSDRIQAFMLLAECIQLFDRYRKERRHLIDKSSCAAGTRAVHALIHAAAEEYHLRIFAPEFDDHIRIRFERLDDFTCCKYFLHKRQVSRARQSQSGGTGKRRIKTPPLQEGRRLGYHFQCFVAHLRKVSFVLLPDDFPLIDDDYLRRRRSDIHPQKDIAVRRSFLCQPLFPRHAVSFPPAAPSLCNQIFLCRLIL